MSNLKISAPWILFMRQIKALFSRDKDVKVEYDQYNNVLKLYVTDTEKADAIEKLLPSEKEFG